MSTPLNKCTLLHGNCLDHLRSLREATVDAIVCDPPYGLSNTSQNQVLGALSRWMNGDREYVPDSRGFMGANWDGFVPLIRERIARAEQELTDAA